MYRVSYEPLCRILVEREMTRSEFRRKVGISETTVTRVMNGQPVSLETIRRICEAFQCPIEDVVRFVDESQDIDAKPREEDWFRRFEQFELM